MTLPLPPRELDTILEFVSQPTAPFREMAPLRFAKAFLDARSIPYFEDPSGNLVVGVESAKALERLALKTTKAPLLLAIAHLDHPGFHCVIPRIGPRTRPAAQSANRVEAVWHGGGPIHETVGRTVWLADANGATYSGTVVEATVASHGKALDRLVIEISGETPVAKLGKELFGGFSFRAGGWVEGDLLYTKSADDLIGAYAILRTAAKVFARKKKATATTWIGLLTRAEEVGCVGCEAHLQAFPWQKWTAAQKRPIYALSIETSRTLPGAEIGKGPIVRLGDRKTPFDPASIELLQSVATRLLKGKHQRRIMDGGACEGSTALTHGLRVMALSVPLGNYHNQTLEGGPEAGVSLSPAPEFVSLSDLAGLFKICEGLVTTDLTTQDPWKRAREDSRKRLKSYLKLLKPS